MGSMLNTSQVLTHTGEETMKLIKKETKINEDTFVPELHVTLALELHICSLDSASEEDRILQFGKDVLSLIKS